MPYIWYELLGCAVLVLTLPLVIELLVLSLAARLRKKPATPVAAPGDGFRLWAVIPAHNEYLLVGACVRSLLQGAERPAGVLVVAHNCTDATELCAKAAGASVASLTDNGSGGKGAALQFGFAEAFARGAHAVLVVDADSIVSSGLIGAMRRRLASGVAATQCRYLVAEPDASPRTRVMALAFLGMNLLRPRGRARLELSCGIFGNGFALTRATLERVPYTAHSLVEDLEYHLLLLRAGLRVDFVDEAVVLGEMPHGSPAAATQRARWEGGRSRMRRHWTLPLLSDVLRGRWRMLEPLADLVSVPLGTGAALLLLALLIPLFWLRLYVVFAAFVLLLHVVVSASFAPVPGSAFRALLFAPGYLLWKLAMLPRTRLGARSNAAWVRTERNATASSRPDGVSSDVPAVAPPESR